MVFLAVVAAVAGLFWINHAGLPASWRSSLEKELSKQGIEAAIGKLRYIPLRGIEASSVDLFTDQKRQHRLAHLERLVFDLDKTKAIRGVIRLTHLELQNADLSIPVNPEDPEAGTLDVNGLYGKILMSKGRRIEVTKARGTIGGIQLTVDAVLLGYRPIPDYQGDDDNNGAHRRFMKQFVQEISHWQFEDDSPPKLEVRLEADATKWSNLKASFTFHCDSAQRDLIVLQDVKASGHVNNALISIQQFEAKDHRGVIEASIDYDLNTRSGNFDTQSSVDALQLVYSATGQRLLTDFSLAEAPKVRALGQFAFPADAPIELSVQGSLQCNNAMFRGTPMSEVKMDFSYQNQDLFLRNINITHDRGLLTARVLLKGDTLRLEASGDVPLPVLRPFYRDLKVGPAIENFENTGLQVIKARVNATLTKEENKFSLDYLMVDEIDLKHKRGTLTGDLEIARNQVRFRLESSLPPELAHPFFPNQVLEKVLSDFSTSAQSQCYVKLNGIFDTTNKLNWNVKGDARVRNLSYQNVPVVSANTSMDLKHDSLSFSNNTVDFDYKNYDLQRSYQGGNHGLVQVRNIFYDHIAGTVAINALRGSVYPVPLLQMFAKPIAETLTQFRFQSPPNLAADGLIDVRKRGLTKLQVNLIQSNAVDWPFLGKTVTFRDVATQIQINNNEVSLNKFGCSVFGGTCAGVVRVGINESKTFTADLRWNGIAMASLAETYEFQEKGYGRLIGRIELKGKPGEASTLSGRGLCSLEKGELFAVPIFGPLSPIISGILGDRRAGFERAKDAFCNFTITKGVIHTNDFVTQTSNLKFTGNGDVDLSKKTIDMTIRMNARGLLGIITLPLRPIIKGLFQFQGQGPLTKPKWEHVIFTSPPEEEKGQLLRNVPLRATIVPEN